MLMQCLKRMAIDVDMIAALKLQTVVNTMARPKHDPVAALGLLKVLSRKTLLN